MNLTVRPDGVVLIEDGQSRKLLSEGERALGSGGRINMVQRKGEPQAGPEMRTECKSLHLQ